MPRTKSGGVFEGYGPTVPAALSSRGLAPSSINLRLSAVRKRASENADNGWLSPATAGAISRIKGVEKAGLRCGNCRTGRNQRPCSVHRTRARAVASAIVRRSGWIRWPSPAMIGACDGGRLRSPLSMPKLGHQRSGTKSVLFLVLMGLTIASSIVVSSSQNLCPSRLHSYCPQSCCISFSHVVQF